jgi:hypothetical protein
MKKTLSLFAALAVLALWTSQAQAQNLLVNPGLDDPPIHEGTTATGWTLETFKTNSGPSDTANFPTFADRAAPDGRGLWYRAFLGTPADPAQANLTQTVPGIAGAKYVMTGWAHFETFYPGGLDNINAGTGPPDPTNDGIASPTDTVFALEFLGATSNVLSSVTQELRAGGQTNDPDTSATTGGGRDWRQHMLMATAPAGTVSVRVRSSLVDGILNPGVNPQSAFVDDFSLTIIPEPASVLLGLIGLVGLLGLARRR